jgi:glycosyltransferase involved in cell wall biosynthesis
LKFSIIIPCYNQAHFLSDCLDSVISQTYDNWEAIVVNDGSTDNTKKVANYYCNRDSRIKLVEKLNGGLSSARNEGIKYSTGEWLLFLDADDMILDNCLLTVYNSSSDIEYNTLLHYGYQYVDFGGINVLHKTYPSMDNPLLTSILIRNIGPCHSIIINKKLVNKIGFFDESLKSAEDWDFWIRAAKCGANIKNLKDVLVSYRIDENSMSRNAERMYEALKTVALRAVKIDPRLSAECVHNINYPDIDSRISIKRSLVMCLGVLVVQNKLEEAKMLYLKETQIYDFKLVLSDWVSMCSYLTFRYSQTRNDLEKIFNVYRPAFITFFQSIDKSTTETAIIINKIFYLSQKKYNIIKYGFWGKLLNQFVKH